MQESICTETKHNHSVTGGTRNSVSAGQQRTTSDQWPVTTFTSKDHPHPQKHFISSQNRMVSLKYNRIYVSVLKTRGSNHLVLWHLGFNDWRANTNLLHCWENKSHLEAHLSLLFQQVSTASEQSLVLLGDFTLDKMVAPFYGHFIACFLRILHDNIHDNSEVKTRSTLHLSLRLESTS